jgi:DNA polymerase-3 subunit beta
MDASEYPELPSCTNEPLQLPSDVLAQGLACTVQFASTEETKQVLTGVHITLKGNDVEFASTDGHRLAVVRFKVTETLEPFTITLPSKALASLSKIEGDTVELSVSETNAQFKCGDAILICRSLDGAYPNYPQLIPNQFSRTATVEKRALAGALDRLSVLADPKNSVVYIDLSSTSLLASVESKDVGNGQETIPSESNISDIFCIAFNNKYMLEGLKAVSGEVKLQFNENNQPFIIQPVEGLNFTYLVMPVQIR